MPKSYFTVEELCESETAKKYRIDNTPTKKVRGCLQLLIDKVLDPVRRELGEAITTDCGYRCPALNSHPDIKGAATSQHLKGEAADLVNTKALQACFLKMVESKKLIFDQFIIEKPDSQGLGAWLHVSYSSTRNRGQVLIFKNGAYVPLKL
jgi:zinc D-Ala-D-Ala carboxypeptidase